MWLTACERFDQCILKLKHISSNAKRIQSDGAMLNLLSNRETVYLVGPTEAWLEKFRLQSQHRYCLVFHVANANTAIIHITSIDSVCLTAFAVGMKNTRTTTTTEYSEPIQYPTNANTEMHLFHVWVCVCVFAIRMKMMITCFQIILWARNLTRIGDRRGELNFPYPWVSSVFLRYSYSIYMCFVLVWNLRCDATCFPPFFLYFFLHFVVHVSDSGFCWFQAIYNITAQVALYIIRVCYAGLDSKIIL